jgi:hypothetical protein
MRSWHNKTRNLVEKSTSLHGATTQTAISVLTAARTSNPTKALSKPHKFLIEKITKLSDQIYDLTS